MNPVDLHFRRIGKVDSGLPWLVFLHGMLGSGGNMAGIARSFEHSHSVLLVDLRNHGRSPFDDEMDYPVMAADLLALFERLGIQKSILIGHSMGGKVAMYFSLVHGRRVDQLICLDMAPVTYPPRFAGIFDALLSIPLKQITSRAMAVKLLEQKLQDPRLCAFLVHSLESTEMGWRWRFNLQALQVNGELLRSFPDLSSHQQFSGAAFFLYGDQSDYLQAKFWPAIIRLFPLARSRGVAGAGHWLHADSQPEVVSILKGVVHPKT